MKTILATLALLTLAPAVAADSVACFEQCASQGYDRSACMTICERSSGGAGLTQQPGVPRNPYFDAIPDPLPKQKQPVLRVDPKCLDECTAKGYKYQLCRKQCSY